MYRERKIEPPFFEIGPKNYLFGQKVLDLAKAADEASERYGVTIIYTTPYTEIRRVVENTRNILVFAPHMDSIPLGRGLADILPEAIKDAGAAGVMLNHAEKPVHYDTLRCLIERADEVGLLSIVCANTIIEAKAIALLEPNIIVAEPTELIGSGLTSDIAYIETSINAIKSVNKDILVLQGAGISSAEDVYKVILAGADATGASSGIINAPNMFEMVDEMIGAVRNAWNERKNK